MGPVRVFLKGNAMNIKIFALAAALMGVAAPSLATAAP